MSNTFSIPWAAVYRANEEGVKGDLLFGRSDQAHGWKLVECTVAQTRYWACSTAQFTITRPILSTSEASLQFDKELEEYILPEDPIVIDMGYANSLFTDNVPAKNCNRVFFGYIDTINVKVSARGVKVTVSCRDSMRFLIDNKFVGQLLTQPVGGGQGYKIQAVSGFDAVQEPAGAVPISKTEVEDALSTKGFARVRLNDALRKDLLIAWLIYAGSNGSCKPGKLVHSQRSNTVKEILAQESGLSLPPYTSPDPAIEISSRVLIPPKDESQGISNYNIMNKFPLEILKHVGSLEAEPRELYADMGTGRICWRKRRLINPEKPFDLFFLKHGPQGQPPNVISAEVDWSSVGTVSEIIVVNPQAESGQSTAASASSGILKVVGRMPDNRFHKELVKEAFGFRYFTKRSRYIFDETVTAANTENAIALIEAMFRIWGKDLRAGTAVIAGNSFIRPGHTIRTYNFGLFEGQRFRVEAVTHKFTASGSAKGFRTSLAFAESDEDREVIQDKLQREVKARNNGLGMYTENMTQKIEKAGGGKARFTGADYQGVKRDTPGSSLSN